LVAMNSTFFALKRAHQSTLNLTRRTLRALGLTAARFDMLYVLMRSRECRAVVPEDTLRFNPGYRQTRLVRKLGVSRATVSRMLASLEELGFVVRRRCDSDRRQLRILLTELGRSMIRTADEVLRRSGWAQLTVDSVLGAHSMDFLADQPNRWFDAEYCLNEMNALETFLAKIRQGFLDRATLAYRWRPAGYY
jgi:DNA-binding MarR family transcriptional regulator